MAACDLLLFLERHKRQQPYLCISTIRHANLLSSAADSWHPAGPRLCVKLHSWRGLLESISVQNSSLDDLGTSKRGARAEEGRTTLAAEVGCNGVAAICGLGPCLWSAFGHFDTRNDDVGRVCRSSHLMVLYCQPMHNVVHSRDRQHTLSCSLRNGTAPSPGHHQWS